MESKNEDWLESERNLKKVIYEKLGLDIVDLTIERAQNWQKEGR